MKRTSWIACVAATLFLIGAGTVSDAAAQRKSRAAGKTTAKTASAPDSNQVLVRIGKDVITRGDVQRRIESLPEQFRANYASPEGRQQLIDRMVEEKVWLALATKNGVADRPQIRQQLEQQRRDLLVRTYLNEVMASNPAPSDSEANAYYDAHLADYKMPATITVRHIQTKTESDAKRALQWAKGKQKWDDLVKRYSTDSLTRATGGNIGTVTREGTFNSIGAQPAIAEAAFALEEAQVGGPVKTDKGWHVIKVENKKAETTRTFDQVRQQIMRQISAQRSQDFYKAKLEDARRGLGVRPDSTAIKGFVSQKKSARDAFNEAQSITAPEARIEAYNRLLEEHPDSDVSPQAQFMVGFIYSEELKNYDAAERAFRALLQKYPKAELAPSAEWMLQHMREENAPPFIQLEGDSLGDSGATLAPAEKPGTKPKGASGTKNAKGKVKAWSPPDSAKGRAGKP